MFAAIATYGVDGIPAYLSVAIQDRAINRGGHVLDSRIFEFAEYASAEALAEDALDWAQANGIGAVRSLDGLIVPEFCSCCGDLCIATYQGEPRARVKKRRGKRSRRR